MTLSHVNRYGNSGVNKMAVQDRLYTAQDLADMPDDGKIYELHNGVLIEVVSPSNSNLEMQQRAGEYLSAKARLVWIVNPVTRTVDVYRPGGTRTVFSGDDVLDGSDVLPGLGLSLREVFKVLDA